MLRLVVRLAVATLAVAAAGVAVQPSALAAACSSSSGVSVVVDFHQLKSGAAQTSCDAGGAGKYAAAQFTDVGHTLTYVQNEAFVCQVDGLGAPQCARTPPADAYWSLWWSDGKSGKWKYASLGVASLKVPAGGYVALSWQKGNAEVPPRPIPTAHRATSPTSHPTTASPSSHPTQGPTSTPTSAVTSPVTSTGPVSPTSSPPAKHQHHHADPSKTAKPHHHASKDSGVQADAPTHGFIPASSGSGSGGLPGWVAPVAVVVVFALVGTIALLRRKSSGGT